MTETDRARIERAAYAMVLLGEMCCICHRSEYKTMPAKWTGVVKFDTLVYRHRDGETRDDTVLVDIIPVHFSCLHPTPTQQAKKKGRRR